MFYHISVRRLLHAQTAHSRTHIHVRVAYSDKLAVQAAFLSSSIIELT